ncbi:MAG: hypothetical protein QNJ98_11915 [Planctomycetota bacterium]|nr:hypothetical protein [Planctomycetota bacterium]
MGSASQRPGVVCRLRFAAGAVLLLLAACAGAEGPRPVVVENDLFDPNPSRKSAAIAAVSASRDMQWIPRLIQLLDDTDPAVRALANSTLESLTGRETPYAAYASADERRPHVEDWQAWLATQRSSAVSSSDADAPNARAGDTTPWSEPRVDGPSPGGGR